MVEGVAILCGVVPEPGLFAAGTFSVIGGDVRVNKLALDLKHRGKIIVACASLGSHQNGVCSNYISILFALIFVSGEPIEGFVAEYDFLKLHSPV